MTQLGAPSVPVNTEEGVSDFGPDGFHGNVYHISDDGSTAVKLQGANCVQLNVDEAKQYPGCYTAIVSSPIVHDDTGTHLDPNSTIFIVKSAVLREPSTYDLPRRLAKYSLDGNENAIDLRNINEN